jgi:hypothetical protein
MKIRSLLLSIIGVLAVVTVGVERTAAAVTNFNVTNSAATSYVIGGNNNATLTLTRGQTYTFTLDVVGHPFWIVTARGAAEVNTNAFNNGVTGNGSSTGTLTFVVPSSAPSTLFYQCGFHDIMGGQLNIVAPPSVPVGGPATLAVLAGLLLLAAVALLRKRTAV